MTMTTDDQLRELKRDLNLQLPYPAMQLIAELASSLPISRVEVQPEQPVPAAYSVVRDGAIWIYWVSGTSLVTMELKPDGDGSDYKSKGSVRPLKTAKMVSVESHAASDPYGIDWTIQHSARIHFDNEDETVVFPDPAYLPLDNDEKRKRARAFFASVLTATT